ncbi:MAG TPA: DUF190 domain-containing protein [Gemmatimonadaceae bacterium]
MHGLVGEKVLMRIHIGERDKHDGKLLYEEIVALLRARGYAGVTVLRGVLGFGASDHLHGDRSEWFAPDLPIVIECVERKDRIRDILPELDRMIGGGLITLERSQVIVYRPHDASGDAA